MITSEISGCQVVQNREKEARQNSMWIIRDRKENMPSMGMTLLLCIQQGKNNVPITV